MKTRVLYFVGLLLLSGYAIQGGFKLMNMASDAAYIGGTVALCLYLVGAWMLTLYVLDKTKVVENRSDTNEKSKEENTGKNTCCSSASDSTDGVHD